MSNIHNTRLHISELEDGSIGIKPIPGQFVAIIEDRQTRDWAKRITDCVNAMAGIEDPEKLRQAWECCKELELDAYHKLKDEMLAFVRKVMEVGYTFGDLKGEASEQLFNLYTEAEQIWSKYPPTGPSGIPSTNSQG